MASRSASQARTAVSASFLVQTSYVMWPIAGDRLMNLDAPKVLLSGWSLQVWMIVEPLRRRLLLLRKDRIPQRPTHEPNGHDPE
jgi:hypothetical protein